MKIEKRTHLADTDKRLAAGIAASAGAEIPMEAARYTPGPWAESQGVIFAQGGTNIAHVNSHNTSEGRANAHLIAAAPEMLSEMRRFMPVLGRLVDSQLWDEFTAGLGIATINTYRHAILKATGAAV